MKQTSLFLLVCSALAAPTDVPSMTSSSMPFTASSEPSHCETKIKLYGVASSLPDLGFPGTGVVNYHEGAGITYPFLTGTDAPVNIINSCSHMLYQPFDATHYLYWNMGSSGLVQISVLAPQGEYALLQDAQGTILTVNGDANGWTACKNTGDPYNISSTLYQLQYHNATVALPESCRRIRINAVLV